MDDRGDGDGDDMVVVVVVVAMGMISFEGAYFNDIPRKLLALRNSLVEMSY